LPEPFFISAGLPSEPTLFEDPDVSVIIPVYNSSPWLDECLTSVLAQTDLGIEVICVDDGSTDDSAAILDRYASNDPRVRVLRQKNAGQSVARNTGVDAAVGRYVIFLDSDDFWLHDNLAQLVARSDADDLDVVMFDGHTLREGDVPAEVWAKYARYYRRRGQYGDVRSGATMIADMRAAREYRAHVGLYLCRTEALRRSAVRFIPGVVHQDNPYTFLLLLRVSRVAHMSLGMYARRIRPGSTITALRTHRSVTGYLASYLAMSHELMGKSFPPTISRRLAEVVGGVFDAARKQMSSLSDADADALSESHGDADAYVAVEMLRLTRPQVQVRKWSV